MNDGIKGKKSPRSAGTLRAQEHNLRRLYMDSKIFTNGFLADYFEKRRWHYLNSISFEDFEEKEWDEENRGAIDKALEDVFNLRLDIEILENLPMDPAQLDSGDYEFLIQVATRHYESLVD